MDSQFPKILALISDTFPEDWYKQYDFEEETIPDFERKYEDFIKVLEESKEEFFSLINTSILIGEYIKEPDFQDIIKSVKDALGNIPQPLPENTNLQEKLQGDFNINYIECLKAALNMYLDFKAWIQVKIKLSNIDYIHQSNEELSDAIENDEFNTTSYKYLTFVQANLQISKRDHYQTPDIDDFRLLLATSNELVKPNRLGGNKFSLLLKQKTDFLLCKWILRKKDLNIIPIHHIKDSIAQELNVNDLHHSSFKDWMNIIQSHYQFDHNWQQALSADFNALKNSALPNLTILELHRLIKYFKDVSKSINRLTEIRNEILERYNHAKLGTANYDKFVFSILLNYAINNEFSLIVETEEYETILSFYREVEDVQSLTGISNFFPQNKIIHYLLKSLKKKFVEKKALTDINDVREKILTCKQIIEKYRSNVTWSERNYNYVFYLPFDECFVDLGNSDINNVFIASSFVLPLDKTKYIQDFDKFSKELDSIENSLSMIENIESELRSLEVMKKEVLIVKQDLVARDMKSMETIAIFTTIVTFVLASVSNFKFIESAYQAALFVLCLALSLGFFVFLLIIIRQGDVQERIRKFFWKLLVAFVLGTFLWIILIFANDIKTVVRAHIIEKSPKPL